MNRRTLALSIMLAMGLVPASRVGATPPEQDTDSTQTRRSRSPSRALPVALMTIGGATIVGGIYGLALDEDPSPTGGKTIWNTAPVGAVGLATGTLVTAVGGYLYWRTGRDENAPITHRSWMRWTGFGALGVAAVAGGFGLKFARDAYDAGDELDRVCAVSCTSDQASHLEDKQQTANRNALISGGAGVAFLAAGTAFLVLSTRHGGHDGVPTVSVGAAGATVGWASNF